MDQPENRNPCVGRVVRFSFTGAVSVYPLLPYFAFGSASPLRSTRVLMSISNLLLVLQLNDLEMSEFKYPGTGRQSETLQKGLVAPDTVAPLYKGNQIG